MGQEEEIKQLKIIKATLESKVDLLESEISYINQLLLQFGFPEGIESLKSAIEELLQEGQDIELDDEV